MQYVSFHIFLTIPRLLPLLILFIFGGADTYYKDGAYREALLIYKNLLSKDLTLSK